MPTTTESQTVARAESEDSSDQLQARDFGRVAWQVLERAPLTVAWRLFGNLAAMMLRPFALVWFSMVLAIGVTLSAGRGAGLQRALVAVSRAEPGRLLAGIAGAVAVLWLISFVVDALVSSGILQLLARGLRGESVGGTRRLFRAMHEGFPKIVGLRLLEAAVQVTTTLLGLSVAVAVGYAFARGGLRQLPWGWSVLALAIPAFLYLSFVILVRFTMRAAAAPLFLYDRSVGDAIADAARFVLDHVAGIYRLLGFVAGILLVPLLGYWGLIIVSNAVGMQSAFAPLFDALQLFGQIVLLTAFALVSVLFDGTLFAFYAHETGSIRVTSSGAQPKSPSKEEGSPSAYDRSTRIEDLLPSSVEHLLDPRELPGFGRGSDPEPTDRGSRDDAEE